MNADYEGHDVRALVRMISKLSWVKKDRPGDPRLGAIGGSYGGGYQFLGAFETLRVKGKNIFDALAPEITWYDLSQSLAPEGVVRTEWALALSAAGLPTDALPTKVYKALVEGAATGTWPDGVDPRHREPQGVLQEERPALARPPRAPPDHPGAVRPGHDRHALPVRAGPQQLAPLARAEGAQAQHLRRLQRRPHAARRSTRRASTSPPTRAPRSSPAATSRTCRSGSSTSSSRARRPASRATTTCTSRPAAAAA